MATVTLGNIKFNWKGAWNSATAYVVDDVVSLSGSSYVCIQAGTNQNPSTATAYWEQMSQKGTDGTDLTSTLTTQGDILYRDSSGLQRLGAGTSGQFLKTQGTGANPVWGTVEGISVAQQFRVPSDQTGSASAGTVLTNWEENDTDYQAIGSAWTQSSGIFSTTSTGIYLCHWTVVVYGSTSGDAYDPNIQISTDSGSNYNIRSQIWNHTDSGTPHRSMSNTLIFDVPNASNFRLRFRESETNDISAVTTIKGSTSKSYTQITFVRLGAT